MFYKKSGNRIGFFIRTVIGLFCLMVGVANAGFGQDADGVVAIEAENGVVSGSLWQPVSRSDVSAGSAMRVTETRWTSGGSELTFTFDIARAGEYHVNLRGKVEGTKEASVWVFLDGIPLPSAGGGRFFFRNGWEWDYGNLPDRLRASLSKGTHSIRLLSRGAGLIIDKLVVAPNRGQYAASSFGPEETTVASDNDDQSDDTTGSVGDDEPTDPNDDNSNQVDDPTDTTPPNTPDDQDNAQSSDGEVLIEAEAATVVGTMWRRTNVADAFGGAVMVPAETHWNGAIGSSLNFNFQLDTAGDYHINLRGRSIDTREKSVWVYLNGKPMPSAGGGRYFFNSAWEWDHGNIPTKARASLAAGSHTIKLVSREAGLQVDKVRVAAVTGGGSAGDGADSTEDTSDPDTIDDPPNNGGSSDNSNDNTTASSGIGLVDHTLSVSVPSCSAADAVRISVSAGNVGLLASSNYRVFCIAPGDYRGYGEIRINSRSGTASAPRVIRLDSAAFGDEGSIFGEWPARNQALMPSIVFTDSNNWLVDRMTFTGLRSQAVAFWNSDRITLNRIMVRESDKGVSFNHGSDSNTVQNSFFADMLVDDGTVCVGLNSAGTPAGVRASVLNNRIVNNEIRNCVDGVQLVAKNTNARGQPINFDGSLNRSAALPGDFSGTLIAGNDIYTTPDFYTNCAGSRSSTGACGMTENALDIKSGALVASNPVRVIDNRFWGFRTNAGGDALSSGSNDPGSAVVVHFGASKHIEIARNIIWDSTQGISVVRGASNLDLHDNIISDLTQRHGRYGDSRSGIGIVLYTAPSQLSVFGPVHSVSMMRNHIVDIPSSVSGNPGRWGAFSNVQNSSALRNVSINAPAANGAGWIGSGNNFGLSKGQAKFAQLCFDVGVANGTDGARVCLNDVLRTNSSPLSNNSSTDNYWHSANW